MEKNTQGIVAVFALLALLVGFLLGAVLMGEDTETIVNVPVEKIVNVSVVELVEVPSPDMLSLSVAEFMNAVENEEDEADNRVNILDNMDYNFDEISIKEVSDDYTIAVTNDRDTTEVNFEIKLKFKDSHDRYETASYDVTVTFEDGEDTEVDFTKL